jgi:hypothetical protein|tara:strand:+ start:51 stop:1172 length:1122 start_codon:yes stop_codon:yes gene_type:complete
MEYFMTILMSFGLIVFTLTTFVSIQASSMDMESMSVKPMEMESMKMMPAHAGPIGVMGDHLAMKGNWMLSMRVSQMKMKGNILHGDNIEDADILVQPNPYSAMPNMPMNLSVVPEDMTMNMLMVGGMYAPSDDVTLMAMAMFNNKEMHLDTYKGMMGREFLGSFDTSTSDLGSVSLTALRKLYQTPQHRAHLHLGITKGMGKNDDSGQVLTPMNMRVSMTLPYAMQSSDQSTRLIAGITNVSSFGDFWVGNQLMFNTAVAEEDWSLGNRWDLNSWVQRPLNEYFSYSARLHFSTEKAINGRSLTIMAPVQTANPDNYGGQKIDFAVGMNAVANFFGGENHRLGFEVVLPIKQNKRGLQMNDDYTLVLGYKKML